MIVYEVTVGGKIFRIQMEATRHFATSGSQALENSVKNRSNITDWKALLNGRELPVNCLRLDNGSLSLIVDGESIQARIERSSENLHVSINGRTYECSIRDPRSLRSRKRAGMADAGEQSVTASMPGKVVRLLAKVGDSLAENQGILVIEAMKMQNEIRSPKAGTLKSLFTKEGANVNAGEVLAKIE
ncbi:MAG TPA: biotin/lipoyl-containing protein [Terriglobales bacterium]|jgi:biotin carboxyl carrier protein